MKISLTEVQAVMLPASVAQRTHAHLRSAGLGGMEGIALWAGTQDGAQFRVKEAIIPQQEGIRSEHGLAVTVPGPELQRINLHLYKSGLRLLAQIHSHPTHAFHSAMDDEYAIATALGSFSIVVPDFARGLFSITEFATYRLTPLPWWRPGKRPKWSPVAPRIAASTFRIVED